MKKVGVVGGQSVGTGKRPESAAVTAVAAIADGFVVVGVIRCWAVRRVKLKAASTASVAPETAAATVGREKKGSEGETVLVVLSIECFISKLDVVVEQCLWWCWRWPSSSC